MVTNGGKVDNFASVNFLLLDAKHIGRGPNQMLTAIHRDHLPGHRRAIEEKSNRRADIRRTGAALQNGGRALAGKVAVALPGALNGRAGSDTADPDMGGKGLRRSSGQGK